MFFFLSEQWGFCKYFSSHQIQCYRFTSIIYSLNFWHTTDVFGLFFSFSRFEWHFSAESEGRENILISFVFDCYGFSRMACIRPINRGFVNVITCIEPNRKRYLLLHFRTHHSSSKAADFNNINRSRHRYYCVVLFRINMFYFLSCLRLFIFALWASPMYFNIFEIDDCVGFWLVFESSKYT